MELFTKLGLKEICYIVNKMGLTTEVEFAVEDLNINGKRYRYEKKGNMVLITDEDNRQMRIGINYKELPSEDYLGNHIIFTNHEISIDILLENGEYINLYNNIGLPRGYKSFENVQRHDLMSGLVTKYCDKKGNKIASFSLGLDKICLGEHDVYEFTDEGILTNRKLVSKDGKTLMAISGVPVPPRETIESFDVEIEKARIDHIIATNPGLHEFTIEALEDTKRMLDRRDRYVEDNKEFYQRGILETQKAIIVRDKLISGIDKCALDVEGLDGIARDYWRRKFPNSQTFGK